MQAKTQNKTHSKRAWVETKKLYRATCNNPFTDRTTTKQQQKCSTPPLSDAYFRENLLPSYVDLIAGNETCACLIATCWRLMGFC